MEINSLPDIQAERKAISTQGLYNRIQKVGMSGVEIPILWRGQTLSGRADIFVNLLAGQSRGIHMSRLYSRVIDKLSCEELNYANLSQIGFELIDTQQGLSNESQLKIEFLLPIKTRALKSGQPGFRSYPVSLQVSTEGQKQSLKISLQVLYSSTCPQSTALSLELWKEEARKHINADWIENLQTMPAIPHAQRSIANIQIELNKTSAQSLDSWIEQAEQCLSTPVQTLVKKSDEQEFARLNGANTMFCEDSARRIAAWLKGHSSVQSFWARVEHQESLHPHNAVAEISS
jgi:GTP cyclohydrolase I